MRYRLTKRAQLNLEQITYFIALDNPTAAERVYNKVLETCQLVADMPGIGRSPAYLSDNTVLSVTVKKYSTYLIFYRVGKNEVVVVSVVDGRRNLPDIFKE